MSWLVGCLLTVAAWAAPRSINETFDETQRIVVGPRSERLEKVATFLNNPLMGEVLAHHRIELAEDRVVIGEHTLPVARPFLIASLPTHGIDVIVYTAFDPELQPTLNRVFHGPTPMVVGANLGDEQGTVFSGSRSMGTGG